MTWPKIEIRHTNAHGQLRTKTITLRDDRDRRCTAIVNSVAFAVEQQIPKDVQYTVGRWLPKTETNHHDR